MSSGPGEVVVDTMVMSAIVNKARQPQDQETMTRCAELRASCEAAGQPLGQKVHEADRWVAATALRLGVELVSDDAVFRDVPGLAIVRR